MTIVARLHSVNIGRHFRAFGLRGVAPELIDPFLGVDHAWISAPTFPPHPHAGFSAVSHLFLDSETGIANRDSLGTRNIIQPGGLHWAVTGSGVVHEEFPAETGQTVHMLQIFVNLPEEIQTKPPFVLGLEPHEVPVVQLPNACVRVPLGWFAEAQSPAKPPVEVCLLDITLDAGASLSVPQKAGMNAFVLPIRGSLLINGKQFESEDGDCPIFTGGEMSQQIELTAGRNGATVAVFCGRPLRQPVFWQGPMAFASQKTLANAIESYRRGEMGSLKPGPDL